MALFPVMVDDAVFRGMMVYFLSDRYLLKFFHELTLHSDVNKMSSQNIAIVIPPNIIWAPSEDGNNIG